MTRDLSHVQVLVPEDEDDPGNLPLGVLDAMCNRLGCDVIMAVRGGVDGKRYAALAEVAYQWARIAGVDKPDRETYRSMTPAEINHALGIDRETEAPPDPTQPSDDSSPDSSE